MSLETVHVVKFVSMPLFGLLDSPQSRWLREDPTTILSYHPCVSLDRKLRVIENVELGAALLTPSSILCLVWSLGVDSSMASQYIIH